MVGQIKSPYFPQAYPHSQECVYEIVQPEDGGTILATFSAFNIDSSVTPFPCTSAGYLEVNHLSTVMDSVVLSS